MFDERPSFDPRKLDEAGIAAPAKPAAASDFSKIDAVLAGTSLGHILAPKSPNCPKCGAPPSEHRVENYDPMFQDGDVICKCGTKVRDYDAG